MSTTANDPKRVTIYIPADVHKAAVAQARAERRSFSQQVVYKLTQDLEKPEKKKAA